MYLGISRCPVASTGPHLPGCSGARARLALPPMQPTGPIRRTWNAIPLKLCLLGILVLWNAKEFYPLSHFPMYSEFGSYDYVLFLADQDGNPLPLEILTDGIRTARLKKKFNGELGKVRDQIGKQKGKKPDKEDMTAEQMAPAGKTALDWVVTRLGETRKLPASVTTVKLCHVGISYNDGKILRSEPAVLAEHPAPPRP